MSGVGRAAVDAFASGRTMRPDLAQSTQRLGAASVTLRERRPRGVHPVPTVRCGRFLTFYRRKGNV